MALTRLLRFNKNGSIRTGVYLPDKDVIVDLKSTYKNETNLPIELLLEKWHEYKDKITELCKDESCYIDRSDVDFLYPIENPKRIIGLGGNYPSNGIKGTPFYFEKSVLSLANPTQQILIPTNSKKTDYEGELVVIIGRGGKFIDKKDAIKHIGGYTICNDLTEKGFIHETNKHIMFGKSIEGYLPVGPYVLVSNLNIDPSSFVINTYVNGEKRQNSTVSELIITIPEIIETISKYFTLYPGDLILTGTPDGTGTSFNPPIFLKDGDTVDIVIPEIGTLSNIMRGEQQ